jgi:beta-glucosidase/6-phospho-beta-glucosidase/beta-galactosidase
MMGGFECSTHRNYQRRRLDVIAATRHDQFAEADYERMMRIGMRTARDGVRWHLIEPEPYRYDFSSLENQARGAKKTGIQIIWDFFHYGYPDDLNIFGAEFPDRFARFSAATAEFLSRETNQPLFICPVNEISFFSWIAGKIGDFHPYVRRRGNKLRRQLVRATIASIDAVREIFPNARFVQTDPAIYVTPAERHPGIIRSAKNYHLSQFRAFDSLCGMCEPELGGAEKYLDIIGINYYFDNQWQHPTGQRVYRGHETYVPFHQILKKFYERYHHRPIFIAETGIENEARPEWFRYVCEEAETAIKNGVPLEGICLYPIINHPGWNDDRHCHNGLWDYIDEKTGEREIYLPLAREITLQAEKFKSFDIDWSDANR